MRITAYKYIDAKRFNRLLFLLSILTLMSGCSTVQNVKSYFWPTEQKVETEEGMAMEAMDAFTHGKYDKARELFERLKSHYPFGPFSPMAELKSADSLFYLGNYQEALTLYQEFEERHPTNEAMPYVLFQIGSCHFKQMDSMDRDTTNAQKTIHAFNRLLKAYPASPYTAEATEKSNIAKNFLADHELYVARFYVKTKEYDQAQGRLEYLLAQYPDTTAAPQAEQLLTALKSGNPPTRTLRSWIPTFSLFEWVDISAWGIVPPPPNKNNN